MKVNLDKSLTIFLGAIVTFITITIIMMLFSFISYHSEISEEQRVSLDIIQESMPEIKPIIEDVKKDNVITKQEYKYIIEASNEIKRRGLFK